MYKYLETFLGENTRALWESHKTNFRENYNNILSLGAHPYNFVKQISSEKPGKNTIFLIKGQKVISVENLKFF